MSSPRALAPALVSGASLALETRSTKPKRRVTTACNACKKRRTKCDAAQPACRTCAVKQTQCSYDPLQDRRKHGTYKRALEQSEGSRQLMSEIITIIRQYPPLDLQLVLDAIRSDRPLNEVVAYIHRNQNAACHAISAPALALSDQPREPQDNPAFATKINLPPLLQHREGFHVNHERTATP